MPLIDKQIRELCLDPTVMMLLPFSEGVSGPDIISYGLSSCGYDIRLGGEVWHYKNTSGLPVDPKKMRDKDHRNKVFDRCMLNFGDQVIIPPGGYVLGTSIEWFNMPDNVCALALGKSTYARVGISCNITPLEPGWKGNLTIEIENANPSSAVVYVGEGICQLVFYKLDEVPEKVYHQRSGRYQNQTGVTVART